MYSILRLIFLAFALVVAGQAQAQTSTASEAQIAWRLLDYVSVDYAVAVDDGKVVNPAEYGEMVEFAGQIRTRIDGLPQTGAKAALVRDAAALEGRIQARAAPDVVGAEAKALAGALLAAYPSPLAPSFPPDLARGATLYNAECAACHGVSGRGDGEAAQGLDPAPIAFADVERARQRSVFGLYQVIDQGLEGTSMTSFAHLPAEDRWALAFYVGRFAFTDAEAVQGERLWESDASIRAAFPNLAAVTQATPADLTARIGESKARAITAYLRRHPEAANQSTDGTLVLARTRLAESLAAYRQGDRKQATNLALSAYLDGFEPVEPVLGARDTALLRRIETAMTELRAAIGRGAPEAEVASRTERVAALLDTAERALAPQEVDNVASFLGAFTILLREGLEALLIVVAMVAFLRKAERPDMLRYVHGGWTFALLAGAATWAAATFFISISGASRELTEGFGSLLAAVVLVSVGIWMHGKSRADAWQIYIRDKLTTALSGRSAWFLFLLAFVVVYREVFETILFFAAIWSQGGHLGMLAGAGAALVLLAITARALLAWSKRLPIGRFFSLSAILMAGLSIVLIGKGVAALQEAGWIDVHPLSWVPRLDILGVYPTIEGVVAQCATIAVLVIGFGRTTGSSRDRTIAPSD
ncbi:cytochrome c/FTR1 family iron permease [uncultured Brevundimonas sp.]|uniref:cytochrome c/FTR1 family iron permease n=1 Tax=uncultured Brevundimonas sp. TaxID=213418 RepID=UPI0030EC11A2|tara:strand:- start:4168 stop:6108 length:1941 start_codon:yes stop_codon:yes gene_type:complete